MLRLSVGGRIRPIVLIMNSLSLLERVDPARDAEQSYSVAGTREKSHAQGDLENVSPKDDLALIHPTLFLQ